MQVESIIKRLGGEAAIASAFDLSEKAVWQWSNRNSIPGRWHLSLLRLARERGVELTDDELLSATRRR